MIDYSALLLRASDCIRIRKYNGPGAAVEAQVFSDELRAASEAAKQDLCQCSEKNQLAINKWELR